ncbi:Heterocyst differentiation ATP-binding protein HepA [Roseovarius albus]|uniref:Heterocyst differentiation ATP-binding protein HepA n=1 Tax=Roseovarius albus TaxID=1247867 RepID=A0A1X6ZW04_9RHOB|nr:ABC transporter ATP-binding protein [Roseovarius albus]SLN63346.1 Heterocyst differentiation ATP-binding protein HepA [Roseovarius albus]
MYDVFKKLFILLSAQERSRFVLLSGLLVFVAFADVFGISTVLVLLKAFAEPQILESNALLAWLHDTLGFTTLFSFQVFLSLLALLVVTTAQVLKAGGSYAIVRFSEMRGFEISVRLFSSILQQPYSWFLDHNSADISKTVLQEVHRLVHSVLIPCLQLLANGILALSIVTFLVILDPLVSLTAAGLLGGSYVLIYVSLRKVLSRLGQKTVDANKGRYRITTEATGGIKEVKLMDLEQYYIGRFIKPALNYASSGSKSAVLWQMPRFALEALTFAVLLGTMLFMLVRHDGNIVAAIPTLGTIAFAVMKLLPALQNIYFNLSNIRTSKPLLDQIAKEYVEAEQNRLKHADAGNQQERMAFRESLEARNLSFAYPNSTRPSLQDVNLNVAAKSTVGFVGGTGAGKTTLIDSVLGLLAPDTGEILIDGVPITPENVRNWRRCIGYVPQVIYLTDSTVAENIAFGVSPEAIDMTEVERAAKAASLHDFVDSELPQGYQTVIGERGVRLSGGQRQRIGIARALYHDPELLILDEATSALDNVTERAVMDAVSNIGHEKTIIMIAHRLSTVKNCDRIFLMESGSVVASGTYEELLAENASFKELASAG